MIGVGALTGTILNESGFGAQFRADDGQLHLLRTVDDGYRKRSLEQLADWSSYNGSDTSNRHSPLAQIDRDTRRVADRAVVLSD